MFKWVRRLFAKKKPKKNRITGGDMAFLSTHVKDPVARALFMREAEKRLEEEEKK